MRWSKSFIRTRRRAPAGPGRDAEKWMVRAGLKRPLAGGGDAWLPLGWRALNKAAALAREAMVAAGAAEFRAPGLAPDAWLRGPAALGAAPVLRDARGRPWAVGAPGLAATLALAAAEVRSYRELPLRVFQIRSLARGGGREALCLDAYGLDADEDARGETRRAWLRAGERVLAAAGLDPLVADAALNAADEPTAHAFYAAIDDGPEEIVWCRACGYAAAPDAARSRLPAERKEAPRPLERVATPDLKTIEEVAAFLRVEPRRLAKTLLYVAGDEVVAAMVRGDHEVNEAKLAWRLGAPVELADERTVREVTGCPVGFAGPMGLRAKLVVDPGVAHAANLVVGANEADTHLVNANPGRDFTPDLTADIRRAGAGEPCPRCEATLTVRRAAALGRVEALDEEVAAAFDARYLDAAGEERTLLASRCELDLAAVVLEAAAAHLDARGVMWPRALAPYEVVVLALGSDEPVRSAAERVYEALRRAGVDAILDDRDESPGVKFNDADLIGFPVQVVVGRKALERGGVEAGLREAEARGLVREEDVPRRVCELLESYEPLK